MASITFRPTINEYDRFKENFIEKFQKKYKNNEYVITKECGKNNNIDTHLQIFLNTDKRIDNIKRFITNSICKNYNLTNLKIALKIKNIKTNFHGVIGYTLKETNNNLDNVIYNKFTKEELLEYKNNYLELNNEKLINYDKKFIKYNNLHIAFKNFIKINWKDEYEIFHSGKEYNNEKLNMINIIIERMIADDYHFFQYFISEEDKQYKIKMGILTLIIDHDYIADLKKSE